MMHLYDFLVTVKWETNGRYSEMDFMVRATDFVRAEMMIERMFDRGDGPPGDLEITAKEVDAE